MFRTGILAAITIITIVFGYVLWVLTGSESFQPYQGESLAPLTVNILIVVVLVSLIIAGTSVILGIAGYSIYCLVRRKENIIDRRIIFLLYSGVFLFFTLSLTLHVFRILHILVPILSFIVVCGIVAYGRYRRSHRLQKYISKSNRGGKSQDPVEVPGQQN